MPLTVTVSLIVFNHSFGRSSDCQLNSLTGTTWVNVLLTVLILLSRHRLAIATHLLAALENNLQRDRRSDDMRKTCALIYSPSVPLLRVDP